MSFTFLLLASQPAPAQPPADIEFNATATARRVVVEQRGETSLTVHAAVNGQDSPGNRVDVEAPTLPQGQRELRDVRVNVHAEARLAPPAGENTNPNQEPAPQPQR